MTTSRVPVTFEFIGEILKVAPRSNDELRRLTGYSRCGIRKHLDRMEADGLIHRRRLEIDRAAGFLHMWHLGPSTGEEQVSEQSEPRIIRGAMPRQKTVQVYPPINRRDDLVTALFGPAHKEVV
jgi:predicted ArsR family transcriptional regulator